MARGLVGMDDAFADSAVKNRHSRQVGSLGYSVIAGAKSGNCLLDSGTHCRSLTGIMCSANFSLTGALFCLGSIGHGSASSIVNPENKTRHYADSKDGCQTRLSTSAK